MKAIVSEKGQVTLPKSIRDSLGIRPGTTIEFTASAGKLVGRKVEPQGDAVASVTGILDAGPDVDGAITRMRGPVE